MRYLITALLLGVVLGMTGCGFFHWLMTDPNGGSPGGKAIGEGLQGGLSAFEQGGIWAGISGFVLTTGKTLARLWRTSRPQVPPPEPMPAPLPATKP